MRCGAAPYATVNSQKPSSGRSRRHHVGIAYPPARQEQVGTLQSRLPVGANLKSPTASDQSGYFINSESAASWLARCHRYRRPVTAEDCRYPKCTQNKIEVGHFGRRVIQADPSGGGLSSDGGAAAVAPGRSTPGPEPRGGCGNSRPARSTAHPPRQARYAGAARLHGLCCGCEDLSSGGLRRGGVGMRGLSRGTSPE